MVPPLELADAADLLHARAGLPELKDTDALAALAALLGGTPLTLALMGGYLHQHGADQPDWFIQTLDGLDRVAQRCNMPADQIEQTRLNVRDGVFARLRHKQAAIEPLSSRIIVEMSFTGLPTDARATFIRLAALPPDPLSFGLETARVVATVDEQTLQVLVQRAWLDDAGDGRFRMHRLVADWAIQRHHAGVEEARRRLHAWHLDLAKPAAAEELELWRRHADNWPPLFQIWQKVADDREQLRGCMQSVLPLLIDQGYWNTALVGLERVLSLQQGQGPLAPLAHYYMGLLQYRRADFARAHADTSAALEGFRAAQQLRSQVMALNLLGHIQKATGNYAAARETYETALGLTPEADGRQHAACLTNLALLFQAMGDCAAARPLYDKALTICEKAVEPTHPDIAASLGNLAGCLYDQGHYAAARPLCERALAIHEQALGPHHPHTAASLTSLAMVLRAQGAYADARPLYERALAIHEQALGPTHPDTATSLANMAILLHDQGDYPTARVLYERTVAIHERVLGPTHPHTATSLANLASLLQDQGAYAEARPLYERALTIHELTPGPNHPDTATSLISLASLLKAQGDLAAARPLYERALAIHEQALGPHHPHTAASLTSLAGLLLAQGDYVAARPLYERALAIREQRLGPRHPNTADSLRHLAGLLREQGDLLAARTLYERALTIHERCWAPAIPMSPTASPTWHIYSRPRATIPPRARSTSAPWRFASRRWGPIIQIPRPASTTWPC